jgi:lipopolysaccharide export system permease protein
MAFRSRSGGSVVASLGVSLTLALAYYILISIGISLGHAGKILPFLAAWLPHVFFLSFAGYLWLDLDR